MLKGYKPQKKLKWTNYRENKDSNSHNKMKYLKNLAKNKYINIKLEY